MLATLAMVMLAAASSDTRKARAIGLEQISVVASLHYEDTTPESVSAAFAIPLTLTNEHPVNSLADIYSAPLDGGEAFLVVYARPPQRVVGLKFPNDDCVTGLKPVLLSRGWIDGSYSEWTKPTVQLALTPPPDLREQFLRGKDEAIAFVDFKTRCVKTVSFVFSPPS